MCIRDRNKAFGMMNKSDADPNGNYADYLAGTVESNKNSFTDDELKTLNEFWIKSLTFTPSFQRLPLKPSH